MKGFKDSLRGIRPDLKEREALKRRMSVHVLGQKLDNGAAEADGKPEKERTRTRSSSVSIAPALHTGGAL